MGILKVEIHFRSNFSIEEFYILIFKHAISKTNHTYEGSDFIFIKKRFIQGILAVISQSVAFVADH